MTSSTILTWIASLGTWNWFILGALFLLLELLAPGTFMLWLGLSAILVGGISVAVLWLWQAQLIAISIPVMWSWQAQVIAFGVFALASIPAFRHFARKIEGPADQPFLNRRVEGYVGRTFTLEKPIIDGVGTVRIDDTIWRVSGHDCPAGSRVKITRADGANLSVEAAA